MNEDDFWDRFYADYWIETDDEYTLIFDDCDGLRLICNEQWWLEASDGVYPIVLDYILIPLTEDDEPVYRCCE